jgi:hypothetical protein
LREHLGNGEKCLFYVEFSYCRFKSQQQKSQVLKTIIDLSILLKWN